MSEITTPPPAKAPPLFILDLNENGGHIAPTNHKELISWIQTEIDFWSWLHQRHYGNHDIFQREALSEIHRAFNAAQQSLQHIQSNPQHSKQELDNSLDCIRQVFQQRKLPHSSTPLAKRVEAYRKDAGDLAASYFLAVSISSANRPPQFQPSEFAAWRGLVEGLQERFPIQPPATEGKKAAAEQSFDQLRTKAEQLVGEKTEAYNALHRDYQTLAESIRSAAGDQATGFETAQGLRQSEFDQLKAAHEQAMEALRQTFREELALRAPAEYWKEKLKGHRRWAWVSGGLSFLGIGSAAAGLSLQIHELLNKTPINTAPETWRLAVLALIGVFTVWALRLVVRMFLSHLHLLTDAGERVVMVQTYLSLLEGDHLASKEDRQLILQALFRPATDGIVKDEGIPFSLAEALTRNGKL